MTISRLPGDEIHFGFNLRPDVSVNLQRKAASIRSRTEALVSLKKALKSSPHELETLVAIYRLHCYDGDIDVAEDVIFQALVKAASLGGFDHDWNKLDIDSTDWNHEGGPGQIYLDSLKALAFIRLRQQLLIDAERILSTLARLDPKDRVGAGVVRALFNGVKGG